MIGATERGQDAPGAPKDGASLPLDRERRQVEAMAGYGVPDADIAVVLGTDINTLRARFAAELGQGHIKVNARVAESLYRKALGEGREAVIAAILWLKTRACWRETTAHEISSNDKQPVRIVISAEDAGL